ncbi:MAG: UDP-N-acetylmuramate dehydrogenase [Erysipelotrichia bacterium]|nr:UDP-N-acetylmuramate dehydrogenase [Erysipelotrichia bacterium]
MADVTELLTPYGHIQTDVSFKNLTTFKVGGIAKYVIYPYDSFSLISIIQILKKNGYDYKVLGNGSNILCSDDEYDGFIIKLNRTMNKFRFDNDILYAQAGCSIISLAYQAMQKSLSGLEFASGIPGTLAGCIYMNAGAYKSDMSQIVEEVEVLIGDKLVCFKNEQCDFAYRHSVFQTNPDWIIISAKLKLELGDKEKIAELMKNRQERRLQSQPLEYPSAGSTFRNCQDVFAWKLIDEIGYRGKRIGGAQVSEKHSNFIINFDNATAQDILDLAEEIKDKVKDKYDINMIMEVEKFNWKK